MCGDAVFLIFVCMHIGELLRSKGRQPTAYQVMAVVGWIGGEIVGAVIGGVLIAVLTDGHEDAIGIGIGVGGLLGVILGAGPVYLLALTASRDPNYRPPQTFPSASPYGPPPTSSLSPFGPSPQRSQAPAYPLSGHPGHASQQATYQESPAQPAPSGKGFVLPEFLPASSFVPGNVPLVTGNATTGSAAPRRVQFYCPGGHVLEEWSTAAGQQRRCPHCSGIAVVPSG